HAILLHRRVILVDDFIEREAILKSRAAAARYENAQLELRIAFLVDQRLYLGRRRIGEDQRRRHLGHCIHRVAPVAPASAGARLSSTTAATPGSLWHRGPCTTAPGCISSLRYVTSPMTRAFACSSR